MAKFGTWLLCAMLLAPMGAIAQTVHIAAVVNDDIITTSDVEDRIALITLTNHLPTTPETQQKLAPRILESLIGEQLQLQEAKRQSIEISDAELNGAYNKIDSARGQPAGTTQHFLASNPQYKHTVESQIRAQLSWNKVIDRKIKRGVNIADDEITRAQLAQASAGATEVRIAAISIPIRGQADEARAAKLARDLSDKLNHGEDFLTLARQLAGTNQAQLNPPTWVAETELQPAMQQAVRGLQPKQITQPLRSQNSFQLITLLDRRVTHPQSEKTEVTLRELTIPFVKTDPKSLDAAHNLAEQLRKNPGSCSDTKLEAAAGKATANIAHVTYAQIPPQVLGTVEHMQVGEVSAPLLSDTALQLLQLCERAELPSTLPPAEDVKRKLFAEKVELEAEKYLRNLRRDAFIEIKGK